MCFVTYPITILELAYHPKAKEKKTAERTNTVLIITIKLVTNSPTVSIVCLLGRYYMLYTHLQ